MGFYERILRKKKSTPSSMVKKAETSKEAESLNNISDSTGNKNISIWSNKGNTFVESGMYAEAIQCYEKALEINPKRGEIWNNKGLALARTGRHSEAVQCYDKALEIAPGDAEIIYNKGIALSQLGNHEEAIRCYGKLIEMNPADASAWCSKGDVLFESGNFEEALLAYDKSIEISPKDETAWNNRGLTLVKLNRFTEAVESYDKALEVNPKIEKIWSNKGLALARMRENSDKVDLQKIATSMPAEENGLPVGGTQSPVLDSENHELKAHPFEGSGEPVRDSVDSVTGIDKTFSGEIMEVPDPAVAEEHPFTANQEGNPQIHVAEDKTPLKTEITVETVMLNEERAAIPEKAEKAVHAPVIEETVPPVIDVPLLEAESAKNPIKEISTIEPAGKDSEKHRGAKEMKKGARRSRKISNEQSMESIVSGNELFSMEKYEEAIKSFDKSLEIDPGNNTAWNNKGMALARSEKFAEAIQCYDKALEIDPDDYVVLNNKGSALYKNGCVKEAMECYKSALDHNAESGTAIRGMEICLKYLKKFVKN